MPNNGERTYEELKELIESKQDMQYGITFETKLKFIATVKQMSDEAVIDLVRTGIAELGHRLAGVYKGTDQEEAKMDLAQKGMQDCIQMFAVSVENI